MELELSELEEIIETQKLNIKMEEAANAAEESGDSSGAKFKFMLASEMNEKIKARFWACAYACAHAFAFMQTRACVRMRAHALACLGRTFPSKTSETTTTCMNLSLN